MEKVKYVIYKVLIAKERATRVFDDMITIPENKPYSEIPAFISAYVRTRLENIMLTKEERAEICNDKKTYEQGLADAWEAAKKIVGEVLYGGFTREELYEIFGEIYASEIMVKFTASEAIAKIKAYEEKQQKIEQEIKVGDEVVKTVVETDNISKRGIVTHIKPVINDNLYNVLWDDGRSWVHYKKEIKKTGRHFSQVDELLQAMKERDEK